MNALSKEENVRGSIKKYFIDNISEIPLSFDKSLSSPDLTSKTVVKWINFRFGTFSRGALAEYLLSVYCCTRQDPEGVEMSKIVDQLMTLLLDPLNTDGMRRIDLYDVSDIPWVFVGRMVVQDIQESPPFVDSEDESKLKIFTVRLRWGNQN